MSSNNTTIVVLLSITTGTFIFRVYTKEGIHLHIVDCCQNCRWYTSSLRESSTFLAVLVPSQTLACSYEEACMCCHRGNWLFQWIQTWGWQTSHLFNRSKSGLRASHVCKKFGTLFSTITSDISNDYGIHLSDRICTPPSMPTMAGTSPSHPRHLQSYTT